MTIIQNYIPKNPTEALLMRFCKRKCNLSQQNFFSLKDVDGVVWHFSGSEYYCINSRKILKKKNILKSFKEEEVSFDEIK